MPPFSLSHFFQGYHHAHGGDPVQVGTDAANGDQASIVPEDGKDIPKIHPSQKPVKVLDRLIEIFTDEGDVVIDPCCGSGTTLRAAHNLKRSSFDFEIDKTFFTRAKNQMLDFSKKTEQITIEELSGDF